METTPIPVACNHHREKPMPCFIRGCHNQGVHLSRFNVGVAVIQVCLCDECVKKPMDVILNGLTMETAAREIGIDSTGLEQPGTEILYQEVRDGSQGIH